MPPPPGRRFAAGAVLLLLLLAALLTPGCPGVEEGVTIEFWTLQLSPAFDGYFHPLIAEYESAHPGVRVRWVDIPYDGAVQKLLAAVAAGEPPDVVNMSADFLSRFAELGAFADLAVLLPPESVAVFLPNAVDVCRYRGTLPALPWYLNTYVLIFNRDLLRAAGVPDSAVPATYTELAAFVRTYRTRTGKFAFFWNLGKDSQLPIMLEAEGVPVADSLLTRATFNTPAGVERVGAWVDLYRGGFMQRESIIRSGTSVIEAYQSGSVAMVLTGPVFLERVRVNAPGIYAATGVAPAPVGATGRHELATMTLSVSAGSRHTREAADFLLFVLSAKNQLAFSRRETTYPSVTAALRDSFFTADDGTLAARARAVGARTLPVATTLARYTRHPEFVRLRDIFGEAVQEACLGKRSTQEALDAAAVRWNRIFAEGGR
jgi:putative chitobiose transport system substrate-binding protein